jgi:tagatose-1,6-bisphosphate aldolase
MKLQDLMTANHHFTLSAFDHRSSLVKLMKIDDHHTEAMTKEMIELKSLFMRVFSPLSSSVLTDPIYGRYTVQDKAEGCGLLLSLEESGYDDEKSALPKLLPDWGIAGVKGYMAAGKFLLYFHPREPLALEKITMVKNLYHDAQKQHVPFLLEVVLFQLPNESDFESNWHQLQLEVVELFEEVCDVLKIEYPGLYAKSENEAGEMCSKVTLTSSVPWIILSRGMKYEKFAKAVEISKVSGSAGFAVGRAVWQELDQFNLEKTGNWDKSIEKVTQFLETTAVIRLRNLIKIVEG